jgi:hypothetical protein
MICNATFLKAATGNSSVFVAFILLNIPSYSHFFYILFLEAHQGETGGRVVGVDHIQSCLARDRLNRYFDSVPLFFTSIDIVSKVHTQPHWLNDFDLGTEVAGGNRSQVLCEA